MLRLAFFLALLPACAASQVVEGNVVNSLTGAGIAGVKVTLYWQGDLAYSTTSDAQGHFVFDHVQSGSYMAGYSAPGYEADDMFRAARDPLLVQVTAGGPTAKLLGHMMPMGHLTGRVVDPQGQPVAKAQVEVSGPGIRMNVTTDAQGKFDLHDFVFPGIFTVSAVPPPDFPAPASPPAGEAKLSWSRTWYPSVTVPEGAAKVYLRPGGDFANIDIKLAAAPAHALRGVLLNPDGTPAPKVEITLGGLQPLQHARTGADGAFEFTAAVDGQWRLSAEVAGPGGVKWRATQWLEMAQRDREGIKLQLEQPFSLPGRLLVETQQGAAAFPLLRMVGLAPVNRSGLVRTPGERPPPARTDAGGNFTVSPLYPGAYELMSLAPPGYYLDSVRLGEAEVRAPEIALTSGAAPLTLIYKNNGGTLRGTVEDCGSGGVLLIPQDPAARWESAVRQQRCEEAPSGPVKYEFTALRPGMYYALALTGDGSPFWNPSWQSQDLTQATSVTVRAGEVTTAELHAVPPAQ